MEIVSTYRLQFHKGFTFADAAAIVPYLHALGITHVYASPYLKAVAGSTHGYDVIDHSQLNPELGSAGDYDAFLKQLADHGMSHILDTVPNHMGVETNDNVWWNDVLMHGPESAYASFFDINWDGFPRQNMRCKVLVPVLGETLAEALSNGLIQLKFDVGKPFIHYHQRRFPVRPDCDTTQPLAELLEQQHYRLCCWRVAADEINYRRFFDISGLAALQMQRDEVFDAVHRYTFELVACGAVAGLRVDHPDGLLDPQAYLANLTKHSPFVWAEKILNGEEKLCKDWPIAGTSGYDFLSAINDLFVDSANESAMSEVYIAFTGDRTNYADWVYRAKRRVMETAMYSEMELLASRLDALAQASLASRDFTRHQLRDALREIIACFPVYRSYVSVRGVSESDILVVDQAVKEAKRRNCKMDPAAIDFVRSCVLLQYPATETVRKMQLDFALHFQQLTAPVNAKGIEDCAFYNYHRLTSLNEVGGDPGRFGRDCESAHRYLADRQANWPLGLSPLSTHDTKRSEDVRARLNVVSEMPAEWGERLARWKELNADLCSAIHPNDQCLLYQTLLGAWPLEPLDEARRKDFAKRISDYLIKATREAKERNSWVNPDTAYEAAITGLVDRLLDPKTGAGFLADFLPFQSRISRLGMLNSLAQTTLRLTAPGISDTYQGTELWDYSLVDPDNRRPVDFDARSKMLADLKPQRLIRTMEDGRIKLWVTTQLLRYRRANPVLFLKGWYEPIQPQGEKANSIFCFVRRFGDQALLVVVPRLLAPVSVDDRWGNERWGDTRIQSPGWAASNLENILAGQRFPGSCEIFISDLLKDFPVAVLVDDGF